MSHLDYSNFSKIPTLGCLDRRKYSQQLSIMPDPKDPIYLHNIDR